MARSLNGTGVHAEAPWYGGTFRATSDWGTGVKGLSSGAEGVGVQGQAYGAGDGRRYGGYFTATGARGTGLDAEGSTAAIFDGGVSIDGSLGAHKVYAPVLYTNSLTFHPPIVDLHAPLGPGINVTAYVFDFVGPGPSSPIHVRIFGDLTVTGDKGFVQAHPTDPDKQIVYVCLEGGENGVYVPGSGQLESGRAEMELPEHFALVAAEDGLTAQITPRDGKARGYLYVEEVSPDHITVVESGAETSDARFDYLVMGVRRGLRSIRSSRRTLSLNPMNTSARRSTRSGWRTEACGRSSSKTARLLLKER